MTSYNVVESGNDVSFVQLTPSPLVMTWISAASNSLFVSMSNGRAAATNPSASANSLTAAYCGASGSVGLTSAKVVPSVEE